MISLAEGKTQTTSSGGVSAGVIGAVAAAAEAAIAGVAIYKQHGKGMQGSSQDDAEIVTGFG